MNDTEEWDELLPVRFDAVGFEMRGGDGTVVEMDWHVVGHLDSILDAEEQEFYWEIMRDISSWLLLGRFHFDDVLGHQQ